MKKLIAVLMVLVMAFAVVGCAKEPAAEEAGVPFAFAAYGFGQATKYDYKLSSFEELAEIF